MLRGVPRTGAALSNFIAEIIGKASKGRGEDFFGGVSWVGVGRNRTLVVVVVVVVVVGGGGGGPSRV